MITGYGNENVVNILFGLGSCYADIIPRGNFYQSTGGQWIYKINSSKTKAVKVPLNIGRQNPLQYEITEGLQPGEFVVITGYDTFGDAEELILK